PQESKGVNNDKVIAPGMFRINPFMTSREEKHVPNRVSASAKTKPLTVSQPPVITKKDNVNGKNFYGKNTKAKVSVKEIQMKYQPKVTKSKKVGTCESLATPKPRKPRFLLRWSPTGKMFDKTGKIVASSESKSCSKHMIGNLKLLINFVWKFMGTVRFGNDHIAAILGFGDLQWGNILITRLYFVEGLGHNLFLVRQFYDLDLEVAFRRNACFVKNLEGVDVLKGDRSTNLYTINLQEMASVSPICLMARASSTKSWLWHQRLSHLNFDTINDLARNDLVVGLSKFKYHKEHLCPSCEQRKSKRASHPPKPVPNSRQRLHLLHMDLNNSHDGYDCQQQFPFVYEQEPSYNQNYDDLIQTPQYSKIYLSSQETSDEVFQANHSIQNEEPFENPSNEIAVSNPNQEKEEPSQDSNIRQLIRKECCVEASEKQKQSMEDMMLELVKICQEKEFLFIHDDINDLTESALNSKLLSINSQRLDKKEQEVKNVVEQPVERGNRNIQSLQNFRVVRKSSISFRNTSQISSIHAIAPILSTKEPEHLLSMGYEHLSITSKTESDEVTESNAENLLPMPSECEVTLEDKRECDLPISENSLVCDNHSDIFSDSKIDDDILVYDDDFEDIEYVEASLSDPEIVSIEEENGVEEENVVQQEEDLEDISQIQDVVLREKLLSMTRLISNIESLNSTPDHVLNSFEPDNFLLDKFSPEFETFCDHSEETRSGNTTHADNSLPEYDSFCFEIEPDQERLVNIVKNNISDDSSNDFLLEEADLFLSDNSMPPGIENFADDPEGDVRFLEEFLIDDSILSHESSDSNFEDNPSIPRPLPESPDAETDVGEEILVVMNEKDKFDENEDYHFFMIDKVFSFISVESEDTIFDPGKSKRASHPPKPVPNSRQRLHLLHTDLYGLMRIASINGKRVGISHQISSVQTPLQNGVVERRNRTLVEAARTMLIFSCAPLFLWAEAIATACFTQNRSIIHRRFNKTPYELINGKKPDISFLHVFGALCYPKNDREDIGKLGAKGDIGLFISYSADSCAYRIYNRRTKKIMETMNVSFDELSAMAFEQRSSKPRLQSMTSGQISLGLDLTYTSSTITTQQPSEGELDLLCGGPLLNGSLALI
nr:integrase, catalytic region, zinc finger, CCHC-type, peptidase aspartic, catalytic [Tanacetum cinerariifolium]